MKTYRVCPTLDSFIDIEAKSEDEAINKMIELSKKAVLDCVQKLDNLGFMEMGADFPFCTDSWYEDSNEKERKTDMKKVTKEMIVQYFDLDVDNSKMTREDFCETIAQILNSPVESRKHWLEEITSYYDEREIDIWRERL